jgi:hypothetical protein
MHLIQSFILAQAEQFSIPILFFSLWNVMQCRPDMYRDLIQGIFSYDWKGDDKTTLAFVKLLGYIVSSNVTFLVPSFQMLVKNLVVPCAPAPYSGV